MLGSGMHTGPFDPAYLTYGHAASPILIQFFPLFKLFAMRIPKPCSLLSCLHASNISRASVGDVAKVCRAIIHICWTSIFVYPYSTL